MIAKLLSISLMALLLVADVGLAQRKAKSSGTSGKGRTTRRGGSLVQREKFQQQKVEEFVEQVLVPREVERVDEVTHTKYKRVFMLIFDHSGSMAHRLPSERALVREWVRQYLPYQSTFKAGIIAFSECNNSVEALINNLERANRLLRPDFNQADQFLDIIRIHAYGRTDLNRAIRAAQLLLKDDEFGEVVLFSDNEDTCSGGNYKALINEFEKQQEKTTVKRKFVVQDTQSVKRRTVKTVTNIRLHVVTNQTRAGKGFLKNLSKKTGGSYLRTRDMGKIKKFIGNLFKGDEEIETVVNDEPEEPETVENNTSEKVPEKSSSKAPAKNSRERERNKARNKTRKKREGK